VSELGGEGPGCGPCRLGAGANCSTGDGSKQTQSPTSLLWGRTLAPIFLFGGGTCGRKKRFSPGGRSRIIPNRWKWNPSVGRIFYGVRRGSIGERLGEWDMDEGGFFLFPGGGKRTYCLQGPRQGGWFCFATVHLQQVGACGQWAGDHKNAKQVRAGRADPE